MYKVKVENACRCFLKSGFGEVTEFTTQEEAKKEAEYMIGIMRSNFCQKHEFSLSEKFGDYNIFIKPRTQRKISIALAKSSFVSIPNPVDATFNIVIFF